MQQHPPVLRLSVKLNAWVLLIFFDIFAVRFSGRLFDFTAREVVRMTDKQDRFCEEYMIDLNATQAAIRAGYSPKTAREQAPLSLKHIS